MKESNRIKESIEFHENKNETDLETSNSKLTLEHLAGYLPYELQIQDNKFKIIRTLKAINNCGTIYTIENNEWSDLYKHKPILRPLSDLTKEIEHNGEKFVPTERFYELIDNLDFLDTILEDIYSNNSILYWNYDLIIKLQSWHFDIHGLIDKNLAIDINTL